MLDHVGQLGMAGVSSWLIALGYLTHLVFLGTPSQGMKVADLIDNDTRQWDRGKLSATFDSRTCDTILALPLNNPNS